MTPPPTPPVPPTPPPRVPLHERPDLQPPALPPAVRAVPAGPRAVVRSSVSVILDRTGILPAAAQQEIAAAATHVPPPPSTVRGELFRVGQGYRRFVHEVEGRVLLPYLLVEGTSEAATGRSLQENYQLLAGTSPQQLAMAAPLPGRASSSGPPAPGYPAVVPASSPRFVGSGRIAIARARAAESIQSGASGSDRHIAPAPVSPAPVSPLQEAGQGLGGLIHRFDLWARQPVFPEALPGLPDPPREPQASAVDFVPSGSGLVPAGPPAIPPRTPEPPLRDPTVPVPPDPALVRASIRRTTYTR